MNRSPDFRSYFSPLVLGWFFSRFGEPTPPQSRGWPLIASGRNTLILAPTGSGKTLAAFLWIIDELIRLAEERGKDIFEANPQGVHTLYVSPLKALNYDIERNLWVPLRGIRQEAERRHVVFPKLRVMVRTGDTPPHIRQSMLRRPPHILITTPESLYLLLTSLRGRELFRNVRYVIVDEIHALCGNKRGVHLSLSLERIAFLSAQEPVRIGLSATQRPLERIAAYLGGQRYNPLTGRFLPRPVEIVDCGGRKKMDVCAVCPVADFSEMPQDSAWSGVIETVYRLIRNHRSTLVFVNMRAQAERIARQLNELHRKTVGQEDAEIARPHHGSLSRAARLEVERRLKEGTLPAVVATASLELGIDIGHVDLVVQVESPRSVTAALQRVGRSGHLVAATSKGRILPLYRSDLDDAVAMVRLIREGSIEEVRIPENCLDVLAQQIPAEVSMQEWNRRDLYRLFRQSYNYRHLPEEAFNRVIAMLAGEYADETFRALRPRLLWDRTLDRLSARRGARLLAIRNGGTIPDRGYYAIVHAENGTKLGEIEEEFVFESRVGDAFYLGSMEWRIEEITHDQLRVRPTRSVRPRPPFWKGEILFRDYQTQQAIAALRREMAEHLSNGGRVSAGEADAVADGDTWRNLQRFLRQQKERTGKLPSDRVLVIEGFRDRAGDWYTVLHTSFGARVNAPLAFLLHDRIRSQMGLDPDWVYDDDGILFRLPERRDVRKWVPLLTEPWENLETQLSRHLVETPLFALRFRHNATRALLLPRSTPWKRIPLWLQRLRSADLLQVVRRYPDFPVVAETVRECLEDLFDLKSLELALRRIREGEIELYPVETPVFSPMAAGLVFRLRGEEMYREDEIPRTVQLRPDAELVNQILSSARAPVPVPAKVVETWQKRWQWLDSERKARSAEECLAMLHELAPLPESEISKRCGEDASNWLRQLETAGQILLSEKGWIPAAWSGELLHAGEEDPPSGAVARHVLRLLQHSGPMSEKELQDRLPFPPARITAVLRKLRAEGRIVSGKLILGMEQEFFCDPENYRVLLRSAVAERRRSVSTISLDQYLQFSLNWHGVVEPCSSVEDLLRHYEGFALPPGFFEREILATRMRWSSAGEFSALLEQLEQQVASGQIIVRAMREENRIFLYFFRRGNGALLLDEPVIRERAASCSPAAVEIWKFLCSVGSCLIQDIQLGTGLSLTEIEKALHELLLAGVISCDSYPVFLSLCSGKLPPEETAEIAFGTRRINGDVRKRVRKIKRKIRERTHWRMRSSIARWFPLHSLPILGKIAKSEDRSRPFLQARLLLQRYGVVVKEHHRRERGLLPWYPIFTALKRLEWQGEALRGYFVEGLSGVQFAAERAISGLEAAAQKRKSEPAFCLISSADPAFPYGGGIAWPVHLSVEKNLMRSPALHFLVGNGKIGALVQRFGMRIHFFEEDEETAAGCVAAMKRWLRLPEGVRPGRKLEVQEINGQPAAKWKLVHVFLRGGFEPHGERLILWPSRS